MLRCYLAVTLWLAIALVVLTPPAAWPPSAEPFETVLCPVSQCPDWHWVRYDYAAGYPGALIREVP